MTTSYMGYILIMCNHCVRVRACASESVIKRSLIFERILFQFGGDIKQIPIGYMSYFMCVWMHVLTARTCLHLRICLARDGQWLVIKKWRFPFSRHKIGLYTYIIACFNISWHILIWKKHIILCVTVIQSRAGHFSNVWYRQLHVLGTRFYTPGIRKRRPRSVAGPRGAPGGSSGNGRWYIMIIFR
jgi:hypothetical protein